MKRFVLFLPALALLSQLTATASSGNGFPVQWYADKAAAAAWERGDSLLPISGAGYVKAVSATGESLVLVRGSKTGLKGGTSKNDICAGGMVSGDYFLFTVPVERLAAGSVVDFAVNMVGRGPGAPAYWLLEYKDGDSWKEVSDEYGLPKTHGSGFSYSLHILSEEAYQESTLITSFRTSAPLVNSSLKLRLRAVGGLNVAGETLVRDTSSFVALCGKSFITAELQAGYAPAMRDTAKVGFLGNSFTYYYETPMMLMRIAHSQGHHLVMRIHHKGGRYFREHLGLALSKEVVAEGGYDFFFLQGQSAEVAMYADSPVEFKWVMESARTLSDHIRAGSPSAKIILERTWAYSRAVSVDEKYSHPYLGFDDYAGMDAKLSEGAGLLLKVCPNIDAVSPIGDAFAAYRALYPEFYPSELKDSLKSIYAGFDDSRSNHHANRAGAYLKSCVNYLLLYGEKFCGDVDNCGIEPGLAAQLRLTAEKIVLSDARFALPEQPEFFECKRDSTLLDTRSDKVSGGSDLRGGVTHRNARARRHNH